MLQDLIMAAINEALRQADEMVQSEMGKLTGGMGDTRDVLIIELSLGKQDWLTHRIPVFVRIISV